jgi:photosystem II stability/assembly factor-like uncharacterized protein
LGLPYEAITSVLVDPRDGSNIYVGSDISAAQGRIFKSTNAGVDWMLMRDSVCVQELVMRPDSSNILFAALYAASYGSAGLLKSTDAGATWFRADSGIPASWWGSGITKLAINPTHPDSMIAALVVGGLSRTTNGGALWESIADSTGPQGRNIGAIGIDPENPERIYVSAYSDGRLYISTNDGLTWKNTLPDILYGGGGYHFEFGDPSSTLYMAGSRTVAASKGIFKSSDRGTSWINISAGIPGNFANVWCITRRLRSIPDALFAGISWSFDFRPDTVFGHGVFTSSDGGQSWQDIGIDSAQVFALALSPDERYLYAGVNGTRFGGGPRGVYRLDLGTTSVREPLDRIRSFTLYQNYPNPFNSSTSLRYEIPGEGTITLRIYDPIGREVRTILQSKETAGPHQIMWDGANNRNSQVGTGLYFVRATYLPTNRGSSALQSAAKGILLIK